MTFEEILAAGKDNKIDIYKAYDLLEKRKEQIAAIINKDLKRYNFYSKDYKELESEIFSCTELQEYLINSVKENNKDYEYLYKKELFELKRIESLDPTNNKMIDFHKQLLDKASEELNSNIMIANEEEIIKKITDLVRPGKFKDNKTEKEYNLIIKTSVKDFISEVKKRGIKDIDSKQWIYNNVLLPTSINNAYFEHISWDYVRREFSRNTNTQEHI